MRWFVSLLVLLAGVASAADTQTFTDDLGRTVTVPLHPQRIVSLHDLASRRWPATGGRVRTAATFYAPAHS